MDGDVGDTEVIIDTVWGEDITVRGDSVYIQYTESTEYSDNEILYQMNENIVQGFSLMAGLIGLLVGLICCKELLKIWLS